VLPSSSSELSSLQHQQQQQYEYDPSDTTKWFRASPQHLGRVGFITSMSRYEDGRVVGWVVVFVCSYDGLLLCVCQRCARSVYTKRL
jgi:hypothetical protein